MTTRQLKQPKVLGGIVLVLLLAAGGGWFAYSKMTAPPTQTQEETAKKKIAPTFNQISITERPYLQIEPDQGGRNLALRVIAVKKSAQTLNYELEYQAGSLLQGAFGAIDLDSLPAVEDILLGSCSAGGACTYHEDVKGGTLVAKFEGDENYALKQDWRYFDNSQKETQFASKDAKFQVESKDLGKQRFVIIYNTPGYADGLTGTPVSDPYSLTASGALTGKAELTMRANEEGTLSIMGYDGSKWKKFETTVDGKTATATVDLMELYIVVKE